MIISFKVKNFLSFKDWTEIRFTAGKYSNFPERIREVNGEKITSIAAIYGANGSGKSNLVKAMRNFNAIICMYVNEVVDEPFLLDEDSKNQPTLYEMEIVQKGEHYWYYLETKNKVILKETLWKKRKTSSNEIFTRETTLNLKMEVAEPAGEYESIRQSLFGSELNNNHFKHTLKIKSYKSQAQKAQIKAWESVFLPHKSFLMHAFFSGGKDILKDLFNFLAFESFGKRFYDSQTKFSSLDWWMGLNPEELRSFNAFLSKAINSVEELEIKEIPMEEITRFLSDEEHLKMNRKDRMFQLIIDKAIVTIKLDFNDNNYKAYKLIVWKNKSKNSYFDLLRESDGTRQFINILPILYSCLNRGDTLVIDEIENSLHPLLTRKLLEWFTENFTPEKSGQLIFTTHDTSLLDLDLLRQDEIWFTEKRDNHSTEIYNLKEFKPRFDSDIEKGYLMGRFGAIPYFSKSNPLQIDWSKLEAKQNGNKKKR
jgi:hypothetical protein